jgi:hypothetical protein
MKFMMLVLPPNYANAMPDTMPPAEAVARMSRYNQELADAGVLLALNGLHPPSAGARVTFPDGKPQVQDGPFAEAKEVLGGYWLIDVPSRDEAIAWACKIPPVEDFTIEVRRVQEVEDFPEDVRQALGNFDEAKWAEGQRR